MTRQIIRTSNYQKKDQPWSSKLSTYASKTLCRHCGFWKTLVPAGLHKKIYNHVPNWASFYFMCTFHDTITNWWWLRRTNLIYINRNKLCSEDIRYDPYMEMTTYYEATHLKATPCHTRNAPLDRSTKMRDKLRDHCQRTNGYRGAAHANCNINYRIINVCQ
jgi:hypothetical protein